MPEEGAGGFTSPGYSSHLDADISILANVPQLVMRQPADI